MIRRSGGVLTVRDPQDTTSYIIEPARYDLGRSRVEMIDFHLDDLAQARRQVREGVWAEHIDALLDARIVFAAVPDPGPDPAPTEETS